jgi:hypothetical protein
VSFPNLSPASEDIAAAVARDRIGIGRADDVLDAGQGVAAASVSRGDAGSRP